MDSPMLEASHPEAPAHHLSRIEEIGARIAEFRKQSCEMDLMSIRVSSLARKTRKFEKAGQYSEKIHLDIAMKKIEKEILILERRGSMERSGKTSFRLQSKLADLPAGFLTKSTNGLLTASRSATAQ